MKHKAVSIECGAMAQNAIVAAGATVARSATVASIAMLCLGTTRHINLPTLIRVKNWSKTYQLTGQSVVFKQTRTRGSKTVAYLFFPAGLCVVQLCSLYAAASMCVFRPIVNSDSKRS